MVDRIELICIDDDCSNQFKEHPIKKGSITWVNKSHYENAKKGNTSLHLEDNKYFVNFKFEAFKLLKDYKKTISLW